MDNMDNKQMDISSESSYEETDTNSEEEFEDIFNSVQRLPKPPKKRTVFKRKNQFVELDDVEFKKRFRFSKEVVKEIQKLLEPKLAYNDNRNNPITVLDQLLITLRYYAVGSFQIVGGDLIGAHQTTVGRIVKRVSIALASFGKDFIRMPKTEEELTTTKKCFYEKFNFPNVIGVIDGTHIPILNPGGDDGERFRNRKGTFSINTQVVCDSNMKIRDIVCRYSKESIYIVQNI